jgi:predicted regulator of Ras-like GTPase activity (Roadblock/LC7/MglB family)
MTIPFVDLLKRIAGRFSGDAAESSTVTTQARGLKKPASERLSKTVLPNATRSFAPPDPFRSASTGATSPRNTPLQLGAQRVTTAPKRAPSAHLPPALARALEPKIERTISLQIVDFIDAVPAGYIKPVEVLDAATRVSLKASEIEKGMPEKAPTISLPSLYQQVPEIFLRGVRPDDATRVALPYEKVLEQFKCAQVREDQLRDPAVPQLDTPILKATIQDSQKFGTKIEPIETSPLPSVPVKPATAKTIAEAEPDATVVQEPKKPASPAGQRVISLYSPELKSKSEPPEPPIILSELSPNGTGAPASERVPASSGPPVPTPLPFTPELAKIAFSPPPDEKAAAPKPDSPLPAVALSAPEAPVAKPEPKLDIAETDVPPIVAENEKPLTLSLKVVLQNLPAFQLNGDPASVADNEPITLPIDSLEKQLATGRVIVAPDVFQRALPENRRNFFEVDEAKTPVVLPLEEVLKNLPATILKLRDDQEEFERNADFETPFSIRAKEDAQRFASSREEGAERSTSNVQPSSGSQLEKPDLKDVVAQANALEGIKACAITFSDGLSLAGELPHEIAAEGLCAMAPSILDRISQHVHETKLGSVVAVAVYAEKSAVSFFARGSICLTALHTAGELPEATRSQIAQLVEKLSKKYTR